MIRFYKEGDVVKQGLNIYHFNDSNNFGGTLRIGKRAWRIRRSGITKRWYFNYFKINFDGVK